MIYKLQCRVCSLLFSEMGPAFDHDCSAGKPVKTGIGAALEALSAPAKASYRILKEG